MAEDGWKMKDDEHDLLLDHMEAIVGDGQIQAVKELLQILADAVGYVGEFNKNEGETKEEKLIGHRLFAISRKLEVMIKTL